MIRSPMEPSHAHPIVLFTLSNQSRDVIVLEKVYNPEKLRTNHMTTASWNETSEPEHFVQFCETDAFLVNSLSEFIGTALRQGDAGIVLATQSHRESLEERLKVDGLDVAAARVSGQYVSIDAAAVLPKIMVDGSPDPERFAEVIGSIITRAAEGRCHVRIFGELVALLWADGKRAAALRLEELWNDLARTYSFSLFCAYPIQ